MILVSLNGWNNVTSAIEGLKEGTVRATMRALNRAIASAQTVEVKAIAGDTGIKQGKVRGALSMSNANASNLTATLSVKAQIGLINFRAKGPFPSRGKGDGVTYALAAGGQGRNPHAFIAMTRNGHKAVFERVPGKFMQGRKNRQAIRELFGSIEPGFNKHRPEAIVQAQDVFIKRFDHEMSGAWNGTPVPQGDGAEANAGA